MIYGMISVLGDGGTGVNLDSRLGCVLIYGEQKVGRFIHQCPALPLNFPHSTLRLVSSQFNLPDKTGKASIKHGLTQVTT